MPKTLNNGYDALVIVFENSADHGSTFFEREISHVFESQRILYFKNESMTGEELFQEIWNKMNNRTIFLPPSQRIIICNYIDFECINERWLQEFRTFMQEFRMKTGATRRTQHHYLTFFRYRAGSKLTTPMEEVVETLNDMWKPEDPMPMQHTEYLLYAGGFNTFDDQEKGVVRLLKTLSVQGWEEAYDISKCKNALHVITFDEYYEKKSLICQEELEKINAWLQQVSDPNFDNLFIKIQECAQTMVKSYLDNLKKFERWLGLYPVSVREFTARGFGPFRRYIRNQIRNSELEVQRTEYQDSCMAEFQDSEERKKLYDFMEENLFYSDYKNIEAAYKEHLVERRIHSIIESCSDRLDSEGKKKFEDMILGWVQDYIKGKLKSLEEIKKGKENGRIRYMYEQNLTMKYQNLQSCFNGIVEGTTFQVPPSLPAATLMTTAFINDEVSNDWSLKGYRITGIEEQNILIDSDIDPLEIQYLRIGKYLNLNTPETLGNIKMIIH